MCVINYKSPQDNLAIELQSIHKSCIKLLNCLWTCIIIICPEMSVKLPLLCKSKLKK